MKSRTKQGAKLNHNTTIEMKALQQYLPYNYYKNKQDTIRMLITHA